MNLCCNKLQKHSDFPSEPNFGEMFMRACWVWSRLMVFRIVLFFSRVGFIKAKPFGCVDMMSEKSKMVIWCKFCVVKRFHPLSSGQAWQITLKLPVAIPVYNKGQACPYVILTGQESIIKTFEYKKSSKCAADQNKHLKHRFVYKWFFRFLLGTFPHWPIHLRGRIYKIYQLLGRKKDVYRVNVESHK